MARGLTGISIGFNVSVSYAYYGMSCDKYAENLMILGKYEEKKVGRVKGFVFSLSDIGYTTGLGFGAGKPEKSQSC